jgi:uridine monophosphate synthetase
MALDPMITKEVANIVLHNGNFSLSNGLESQVYVDMKMLISYPALLMKVCQKAVKLLDDLEEYTLVGVPTGGLHLAVTLSHITQQPTVLLRDKSKDYGLKKPIEGNINIATQYVIVEDVVTTGNSVIEFAQRLERTDPVHKVKRIIVLVDREEGGIENIRKHGYQVSVLATLSDLNVSL